MSAGRPRPIQELWDAIDRVENGEASLESLEESMAYFADQLLNPISHPEAESAPPTPDACRGANVDAVKRVSKTLNLRTAETVDLVKWAEMDIAKSPRVSGLPFFETLLVDVTTSAPPRVQEEHVSARAQARFYNSRALRIDCLRKLLQLALSEDHSRVGAFRDALCECLLARSSTTVQVTGVGFSYAIADLPVITAPLSGLIGGLMASVLALSEDLLHAKLANDALRVRRVAFDRVHIADCLLLAVRLVVVQATEGSSLCLTIAENQVLPLLKLVKDFSSQVWAPSTEQVVGGSDGMTWWLLTMAVFASLEPTATDWTAACTVPEGEGERRLVPSIATHMAKKFISQGATLHILKDSAVGHLGVPVLAALLEYRAALNELDASEDLLADIEHQRRRIDTQASEMLNMILDCRSLSKHLCTMLAAPRFTATIGASPWAIHCLHKAFSLISGSEFPRALQSPQQHRVSQSRSSRAFADARDSQGRSSDSLREIVMIHTLLIRALPALACVYLCPPSAEDACLAHSCLTNPRLWLLPALLNLVDSEEEEEDSLTCRAAAMELLAALATGPRCPSPLASRDELTPRCSSVIVDLIAGRIPDAECPRRLRLRSILNLLDPEYLASEASRAGAVTALEYRNSPGPRTPDERLAARGAAPGRPGVRFAGSTAGDAAASEDRSAAQDRLFADSTRAMLAALSFLQSIFADPSGAGLLSDPTLAHFVPVLFRLVCRPVAIEVKGEAFRTLAVIARDERRAPAIWWFLESSQLLPTTAHSRNSGRGSIYGDMVEVEARHQCFASTSGFCQLLHSLLGHTRAISFAASLGKGVRDPGASLGCWPYIDLLVNSWLDEHLLRTDALETDPSIWVPVSHALSLVLSILRSYHVEYPARSRPDLDIFVRAGDPEFDFCASTTSEWADLHARGLASSSTCPRSPGYRILSALLSSSPLRHGIARVLKAVKGSRGAARARLASLGWLQPVDMQTHDGVKAIQAAYIDLLHRQASAGGGSLEQPVEPQGLVQQQLGLSRSDARPEADRYHGIVMTSALQALERREAAGSRASAAGIATELRGQQAKKHVDMALLGEQHDPGWWRERSLILACNILETASLLDNAFISAVRAERHSLDARSVAVGVVHEDLLSTILELAGYSVDQDPHVALAALRLLSRLFASDSGHAVPKDLITQLQSQASIDALCKVSAFLSTTLSDDDQATAHRIATAARQIRLQETTGAWPPLSQPDAPLPEVALDLWAPEVGPGLGMGLHPSLCGRPLLDSSSPCTGSTVPLAAFLEARRVASKTLMWMLHHLTRQADRDSVGVFFGVARADGRNVPRRDSSILAVLVRALQPSARRGVGEDDLVHSRRPGIAEYALGALVHLCAVPEVGPVVRRLLHESALAGHVQHPDRPSAPPSFFLRQVVLCLTTLEKMQAKVREPESSPHHFAEEYADQLKRSWDAVVCLRRALANALQGLTLELQSLCASGSTTAQRQLESIVRLLLAEAPGSVEAARLGAPEVGAGRRGSLIDELLTVVPLHEEREAPTVEPVLRPVFERYERMASEQKELGITISIGLTTNVHLYDVAAIEHIACAVVARGVEEARASVAAGVDALPLMMGSEALNPAEAAQLFWTRAVNHGQVGEGDGDLRRAIQHPVLAAQHHNAAVHLLSAAFAVVQAWRQLVVSMFVMAPSRVALARVITGRVGPEDPSHASYPISRRGPLAAAERWQGAMDAPGEDLSPVFDRAVTLLRHMFERAMASGCETLPTPMLDEVASGALALLSSMRAGRYVRNLTKPDADGIVSSLINLIQARSAPGLVGRGCPWTTRGKLYAALVHVLAHCAVGAKAGHPFVLGAAMGNAGLASYIPGLNHFQARAVSEMGDEALIDARPAGQPLHLSSAMLALEEQRQHQRNAAAAEGCRHGLTRGGMQFIMQLTSDASRGPLRALLEEGAQGLPAIETRQMAQVLLGTMLGIEPDATSHIRRLTQAGALRWILSSIDEADCVEDAPLRLTERVLAGASSEGAARQALRLADRRAARPEPREQAAQRRRLLAGREDHAATSDDRDISDADSDEVGSQSSDSSDDDSKEDQRRSGRAAEGRTTAALGARVIRSRSRRIFGVDKLKSMPSDSVTSSQDVDRDIAKLRKEQQQLARAQAAECLSNALWLLTRIAATQEGCKSLVDLDALSTLSRLRCLERARQRSRAAMEGRLSAEEQNRICAEQWPRASQFLRLLYVMACVRAGHPDTIQAITEFLRTSFDVFRVAVKYAAHSPSPEALATSALLLRLLAVLRATRHPHVEELLVRANFESSVADIRSLTHRLRPESALAIRGARV